MLEAKYIYWVLSGMKRFYKLPLWLRLVIPATLVAVCVAINAVAFTEIWRSIQTHRNPAITEPAAVVITEVSKPRPANNSSMDSLSANHASVERLSIDNQPEASDLEIAIATPSSPPSSSADTSHSTTQAVPTISPEATIEEAKAKLSPQTTPVVASATAQKYGHFSYPVRNPDTLSLVASYAEGENQRDELLHPDAAAALHKMIAAARANGIWLVPASGFRSLEQQRSLFSNQTLEKGSPEAAATVSAPPGYSEHHTGYAIDLADGALEQTYDISIAFAQSPAYAWLTENAAQFGFELSFPEGNPQGVSFEPWHWRYVGTNDAKKLFRKPLEQNKLGLSAPQQEQSS
ncbi:MAG: D-alanyl-D-alanine carboxypeptidase family protein [Phormidesmis sp.]